MIKKFWHCIIILILTFINIFSVYNQSANRISFSNGLKNVNNPKIIIPINISDNITIDMLFDTGCNNSFIYIDSISLSDYAYCFNLDVLPNKVNSGSAWSNKPIPALWYEKSQTLKIGNIDLNYENLLSYDIKKYYGTERDGTFNIPQKDTTHIWELNFEYNYMEIHPADDFQIPHNCFVLPIEKSADNTRPFNIKIPMQIKYSDGDTLTLDRTFFIDTGMYWDIALLPPADEIKFFNKKKDAIWTKTGDGYNRRYTVSATLFDSFDVDSLRIYTFERPYSANRKYLIGLNFLKRFNVFFDMKNRQIGLQPINNFQRLFIPNAMRYHYTKVKTPEGKNILTKVADSSNSSYYAAGIREGDEIVIINGIPIKKIGLEQALEIYEQDTITFDIIRHGKMLKIVVPIDKNKERGD